MGFLEEKFEFPCPVCSGTGTGEETREWTGKEYIPVQVSGECECGFAWIANFYGYPRKWEIKIDLPFSLPYPLYALREGLEVVAKEVEKTSLANLS